MFKNIELHSDENGRPIIRDPRGTRQNHGDWTWLRSGYFLRWRKPFAESLCNSSATLIIFSSTLDLEVHLQELATKPDWRQGVMDPFSLLVVVAENIFLEASKTIDKVLKVLRYTEHVCVHRTIQSRKEANKSSWFFMQLEANLQTRNLISLAYTIYRNISYISKKALKLQSRWSNISVKGTRVSCQKCHLQRGWN